MSFNYKRLNRQTNIIWQKGLLKSVILILTTGIYLLKIGETQHTIFKLIKSLINIKSPSLSKTRFKHS